jgi:hypothetical protein
VGQYRHAAYGDAIVSRKGRGLEVSFHHLTLKARHHHYDVFELTAPGWEVPLLASFSTAPSGRVTTLSAPLQDGVADIVFERVE